MFNIHIIMYHYVRDLVNTRYPKIKGLDYSLFKQQIAFLKHNFNIIRMEELVAAYEEGYQLPSNAALLTFDDGYKDNYTNVFPVLMEHNIQGSFFVTGRTLMEQTLLDVNKIHILLATTPIKELMGDLKKEYKYFQMEYNFEDYNFLYEKYAISNRFDGAEVIFFKRMLQTILPEKVRNQIASRIFVRHIGQDETAIARELYMSSDEMERMQRNGMFFGIHGYDHNWLGSVSKDKMEGDLNKALDVMDEFIDRKCWVMNYPYGSYNNNVIDFISKSGCKLGLTTDVGVADISKNNRFMLPRLDTNDMPPISENYLKLDLM